MQVINDLALQQPHAQLKLNTSCVTIRTELMFWARPITNCKSEALTNIAEAQTEHLEPYLPSNVKHFKSAGLLYLLFAFWRPPTLFNDSRPCCFLWINYLSLFQWQRSAHWGWPCLMPRHTPGIYCKEKARVYSTQTCTIKLPPFRFLFQNPEMQDN